MGRPPTKPIIWYDNFWYAICSPANPPVGCQWKSPELPIEAPTSSIAGLVGFVGQPAYIASKHDVFGLMRASALEYAKEGIRVNAVCPGFIDTPPMERIYAQHPDLRGSVAEGEPVGRAGAPDEVAEAVVWLCSDKASFVTGHPTAVDAGYVAK